MIFKGGPELILKAEIITIKVIQNRNYYNPFQLRLLNERQSFRRKGPS